MSKVAVIKMTYDDNIQIDAPASLIVKFSLPESEQQIIGREKIIALQAYQKEVYFYQYLNKTQKNQHLQGLFSRAMYAHIDASKKDQFCIIMTPATGAPRAQYDGMTVAEAQDALETVAQLHAAFFHHVTNERDAIVQELQSNSYPVNTNLSKYLLLAASWQEKWQDYTMSKENEDAYVAMFDSFWKPFVGVIKTIDLSKFASYDFRMAEHIVKLDQMFEGKQLENLLRKGLQAACNDTFQTLIHCDFRTENLMIDKNKTTILDLQCLNFGNPAYDISMLLSNSLSAQDRKQHEEALLQAYLNKLHECNPATKSMLSLSKLRADYQCIMTLHLFFYASGLYKWQPLIDSKQLESLLGRFLLLAVYVVNGIISAIAEF